MILKSLPKLPLSKPDWTGVKVVAFAGLLVAGSLLGLRNLGKLQGLEVLFFDQMMRLRPAQPPDSRLLIVGVTDDDFQRYRFPLSDATLAQALETLQKHQPALVGLDFYRDLKQPPGTLALQKQLQASNVIAITKLGSKEDPVGIAPPANVPPDRVGFNDVVTDPDVVVRRNLLFADVGPNQTASSLSLQLALAYMGRQQIFPQTDAENPFRVTWGKATFTPLEKNSGNYQTIGAEGYQILLNYRNSHNIARTITLTQLLSQDFDPAWVKDKIVLIGPMALSSKDFFFTPYSASERDNPRVFGVELHAQMLSQLLDAVTGDRPLFWYWSDQVEILWIAGWTLVGGLLAWLLHNSVTLGLSSIGVTSLIFGISFGVFNYQGWIPTATPILAVVLTSGAVVSFRAQQAQKQQQMVMTLLGQNTSPEIAAALWNSRDRLIKSGKLPGQALVATMMFTDIKDFSTISELMPPEELTLWLNEYLDAMTTEILQQKGIVNKFIGDGIMAVFGVPVARLTEADIADDARRAILAGLAMGERLKTLNQNWQSRGLPVIKIRAGIFTGTVIAGSLGGKDRMEYGVIGDSVNIASRLESCEKDRQPDFCRVLAARETLAYVEGEFEVESWGPLALKGRHQLVEVYRVVGLRRKEQDAPTATGLEVPIDPAPQTK